MRWKVPEVENLWGDWANDDSGCTLMFRGMQSLRLGRRDEATMEPDDRTLAGISKVEPGDGPHRQRPEWARGDDFNLLFEFQSGRTLEIAADEVQFTPERGQPPNPLTQPTNAGGAQLPSPASLRLERRAMGLYWSFAPDWHFVRR
jgi:hypothetical protein